MGVQKKRKEKPTARELELAQVLRNTRLSMARQFRVKGEIYYTYYTPEDMKKLLRPAELKKFSEWICGQTCGMVTEDHEGNPLKKPTLAYYASDVNRFYIVLYGGSVAFD